MHPGIFTTRKYQSQYGQSHDHGFDNTNIHENCDINMAIDLWNTGNINPRLHILGLEEDYYSIIDKHFSKLILSMAGTKRSQKQDGQDLPAAKRHTSGGVQHGKNIGLGLQMSKQSEERPQTTPRNPIIIDLSSNGEQALHKTMLQPFAIAKRLPPISVSDNFPLFKSGTVLIILDPRVIKYQYRLHSTTLSRVSPAFTKVLENPMLEASEALKASATDARFRFELVYSNKTEGWILRKTPFTVWKLPRSHGEPKLITTPLDTVGFIKEEIIGPSKHVSNDVLLAPGAEVAHKEFKDLVASLESTEIPVEKRSQTLGDSWDSHSVEINQLVEVNQSVKELESTAAKGNIDSTKIGQSLIESLNQTTEKVENEAMTHVDELMNSFTNVQEEGVTFSHRIQGGKSSNQQETTIDLASTSNDLMNSTIPEKSMDDSVPGISADAAPSTNIPNAPGESISSAKIAAQHNYPEKQFSSSCYPLLPPVDVCEAYNNLFLIFYNKSPKISTICVWIALKQCEDVILVAEYTKSIPVVRPYLGTAISRFGQVLYEAIAAEPYRWLTLSLTLQSAIIFKESIIHIVGQYSSGEDFDNTLPADIPIPIQDLIISKVRSLDTKKTLVNERLFASSIIIDDQPVTFLSHDPAVLSTWSVVQVWRDWFCQQMYNSHLDPYKSGALYRILQASGNAYLPAGMVKAVVEKIRQPVKVDAEELCKDLNLMKGFARDAVAELCENWSMVDVEEARVAHLTCTTVTDEELAWYEPTLI